VTFRVIVHKWWNADRSRLVDSGDPDAAFLAFPAGTELAESEARKVGLLAVKPAVPVTEPDPVPEPEQKIRSGRPADKMGPRPVTKAAHRDDETL
jgi:hypothetical protein